MNDEPENASVHTLRCLEMEKHQREHLDSDVLYIAFVYLNDLIASNQCSSAIYFRDWICKEFEMLENPSEEQIEQIEEIQSLEI